MARQQVPGIALATVYNNLNALAREGRIRRLPVKGLPDHYEKRSAPHDHLVCQRCGALVDVSLGDVQKLLAKRAGTQITGYSLELYYVCPACRAKASQTVSQNGALQGSAPGGAGSAEIK